MKSKYGVNLESLRFIRGTEKFKRVDQKRTIK